MVQEREEWGVRKSREERPEREEERRGEKRPGNKMEGGESSSLVCLQC